MKRVLLLAMVPALAAVLPVVVYSVPDWLASHGVPTALLGDSVRAAGRQPDVASPLSAPGAGNPPGMGTAQQSAGYAAAVPWPGQTLGSAERGGGAVLPPATAKESPACRLEDVLRFDITPGWIVARWPRVSAGLADMKLIGYRVPLVTGTEEDDLAGALTYYFDGQHRLQMITFEGTTGNVQKLVALVGTRFGLARRITNHPQVFVYERPGPDRRPESELWIRPAPVMQADDPHHRFRVSLTLRRPAK